MTMSWFGAGTKMADKKTKYKMIEKIKCKKFILLAVAVLTVFSAWICFVGKRAPNLDSPDGLTGKSKLFGNEKLRIGFVTDIHCYAKENKEDGTWDLNWRCEEPSEFFIDKMNKDFKPDFVVEGGDFVDGRDDRSEEDFVQLGEIFRKLEMPFYHVMGNHETRGFSKDKWLELTGYEKPYYYFDVKKYRVIVLDGNNKPTLDGSIVDTSKEIEYYPAYFKEDQLIWLEKTLKESEGREIIVFVHQPLLSDTVGRDPNEFSPLAPKLRKLFSENGVRAVFSGHIEEFCTVEDGGVQYFVLQGFHKNNERLKTDDQFKDAGVFSEVEIGDKIEVKVYYIKENIRIKEDGDERELKYQSFDLNKETVPCNNENL